jgi:hypothetical protein
MEKETNMYARYLIANGKTNLIPNHVYKITIVEIDEEDFSALYVRVLIENNEYPTKYFAIYYESKELIYSQWMPMIPTED